jgi:hypothetical protein
MLAGFYLLLVWKTEFAESVAAAVCGALAASVWLAIRTQPGEHFRMRATWLLPVLRMLGGVIADCGIVGRALCLTLIGRIPRGEVCSMPIYAAGEDGPEAAGRRALILAGLSLAPDTYALALDHDAGCITLHQLVRNERRSRSDGEWPL